MPNRGTTSSHSNNPSEQENDDNNNPTEKNTESVQGETSVEPNTNPSDKSQQNPLQSQILHIQRCLLDKDQIHMQKSNNEFLMCFH